MSRRSLTRDIHESIRLLLGKNVKIVLKAPVKLELKGGDKTENRILVFTSHRLFVMASKVPTKIEHHYHYLEFRQVEVKRPNAVALGFLGDKTYVFRPASDSPSDLEVILSALFTTVRKIFPGVPLSNVLGSVDLRAATSTLQEHLVWKPPDPKLTGPCGGFSTQYACVCDLFAVSFREEVAWDVDTIYFSHDSREMCLQDFEHLDHRDLVCILAALEHNTWFTKLKASMNSSKLSADLCERILQVVKKSPSLQELYLPSIGVRWEFMAKLSQAIQQNPSSALVSLDISCNFLEDKGVNHFSNVLSKSKLGFRHLNLSFCSLTTKSLSPLTQSLVQNIKCTSTLTYLNLAGNSFKEESHSLCSFLAQPNLVAILDLSNTEIPLDSLFGALVRGCTSALTHLNLARNPFSSKKAKEIPSTFKQFFATTLSLQYLNLSHTKFPAEALKNLLLGLACNQVTANVELNLSNNALGGAGAAVIESCIGGVNCVTRLDLSENNIDTEMSGVMHGIARNRSILSLNVCRNMTGVKPKHLSGVMESIVQLIQDEETVLQKLNLSDCKLKSELNNVINALGSNQSLLHLDIAGNLMGDVGARLLAKALQINTRLKIINLDRNAITLQGFMDITYALQSNFALRHIPFPTYDLQPFIKTHPERVDVLVHRMQELLHRNSNPHKFRNTAQAFRLTQGFLLSSTQQVLDRVAAQTQDSVEACKKVTSGHGLDHKSQIAHAEGLVKDAENSKHLLSALHEVSGVANGKEVDVKLQHIVKDLHQFMVSHVQKNLDSMLTCAETQCPNVLASSDSAKEKANEVRRNCQKKCDISEDFVSSLILDQLGQEIHNKVNELNLIIANHISDKVIDGVIEDLGAVSRGLSLDAEGTFKKKRSLTPDVFKIKSSSSILSTSGESQDQESMSLSSDVISQKSESSPLAKPQTSKRQSLHGRKLRPKSIVDAQSKDSSISESINESLNGTNQDESMDGDSVPELPASTVLSHLGKARPRRTKRHAPSRGAVVHNQSVEEGEDIAKFYCSSANNSFSPTSTPCDSPLLEGERLKNTGASSLTSPVTSVPSKKSEFAFKSTSIGESEKRGDNDSSRQTKSDKGHISSLGVHKERERNVSPISKVDSQLISDILKESAEKAKSPLFSPLSSLKNDFPHKTSAKTSTPESERNPPEDVLKRHLNRSGMSGDVIAEMKEKRSSLITKTSLASPEDFSLSKDDASVEGEKPSGPSSLFGQVKLRSATLTGNNNAPSLNNTSPDEDDDKHKGSIIGLRASKFNAPAPCVGPDPNSIPKPKPLPKPRPWSIVGVDRKSGEMKSVLPSISSAMEKEKSLSPKPSPQPIPSKRSSVRDMINSMNKVGGPNDVEQASPEPLARKGSSLPRSGTSADEDGDDRRTPTKAKNSTSDDPRILKLDDDFSYDEVMDV
ncbi:hypothetical protein TCAL_01606 [Tigriopus californicus]|uniref:CARMIL pleckstrin homology domain-containing protein n=1 Tax=Tigriopus californicus TaxID=6832 RepID=A0A553PAM1_TIGCA|nr:F-actin-uncapping protein LRRC16A-like [Tigriopus californicus]TRY74733.1 hypothetical protein TCAL_01606 [Tigriopus californicus]|eukprot:TCALIF_01606-PA protein Name:"Similar to LRRC16A Leucine-rich repeat-containing protein 16A (Homo sapiens)" AED:0.02 eAED:0.02 QI:7/1/0.5/1/0/0/2/401/1418